MESYDSKEETRSHLDTSQPGNGFMGKVSHKLSLGW